MSKAYYNENNPEAVFMLRKLIEDGLIADGEVDERSITEVKASDLKGFTQHHFFAGVGLWSTALRLAGWPDNESVWTGSCPCQPFSSAGQHKGTKDERHLLPVWINLAREFKPSTIFGEQVAQAIAHGWLDELYQGLEENDYAVGSAVLPACSVGAPHKRQRLWFVAHSNSIRKTRFFTNTNLKASRQGWPDSPKDLYVDKNWFESLSSRGLKPLICRDDDGYTTAKPLLHAIGNGIVPQLAAEFIKAAC